MLRALIWTWLLPFAVSVQAQAMVLEAEVLEGSTEVALPGTDRNRVGYVILHHKHQKDQASLSDWLRHHGGAQISFETQDGTVHAGALQRLKHCFGRGLLLYTDPVRLKEKDVIRLQLDATD